MEKSKKFEYPERQVISKENYVKFLKAQEHTKDLINEIETEIKKAKEEKSMYENKVQELEVKKKLSPEETKKLSDYLANVRIISKAIDVEMALQANLIRRYKTLEKTVFCEE